MPCSKGKKRALRLRPPDRVLYRKVPRDRQGESALDLKKAPSLLRKNPPPNLKEEGGNPRRPGIRPELHGKLTSLAAGMGGKREEGENGSTTFGHHRGEDQHSHPR